MTLHPPVSAAPPLMTAAMFVAWYDNAHAELIAGRVQEYAVPQQRHGQICARLARLLGNHVDEQDLGHLTTNDSFIQVSRDPDTVRAADLCYFSYERVPRGPLPEGILPVVPDLVVEVRSPTDRWTMLFAKVADYLGAGVRVVVVLDPATQTVSVYRDDLLQQIFQPTDTLTIPDVLPGFSVAVTRLFA